jgi:hypothetical protein
MEASRIRGGSAALATFGILLAALVAGCGGSDGDAAAEKPPLENEVQVEVALSQAAQELAAVNYPAGTPDDPYADLPAPKKVELGPTGMPPASAGSNGAYKPRPAAERRRIAARTNAPSGLFPAERTAILLGGTALAPAGAPERIKGIISAANLIADKPYKWGGGHGGWRDNGYDCSGAVSFALAGGGLIDQPRTSGELQHWGEPGVGKWLTIYANAGHTYAVVAGLRWDTVGNARGSGPRWHPFDAYPENFEARHLPGY